MTSHFSRLPHTSTSLCFVFSSGAASPPQMLGLRSSLELKLANDQGLAIAFQLEYVFSAPIGRETTVRGMFILHSEFILNPNPGLKSNSRQTGEQPESLLCINFCNFFVGGKKLSSTQTNLPQTVCNFCKIPAQSLFSFLLSACVLPPPLFCFLFEYHVCKAELRIAVS